MPVKRDQKYCSISCVAATARHRRWEKSKDYTHRVHLGYEEVKLPDGRWIGKHRYMYQQYWGVTLGDTHFVTFLNGDKRDFGRENLALRNKELDHLVKTTGKLPKATQTRPSIPTRKASVNRVRQSKSNGR